MMGHPVSTEKNTRAKPMEKENCSSLYLVPGRAVLHWFYTCKTHGELLFLEPDTGLESQIPDIWSICLHDPGYMVIGYMVIPDTWSILAGPDTDDVSGTHCSSN